MNKLLFIILLLCSSYCLATPVQKTLQKIEQDWAVTYYGTAKAKQAEAYQHLIEQAKQTLQQYPTNTEAMFCLAMIKASMAEHEGIISALDTVIEAKDLLTKIIELNPNTMNGSAYVILGTLYYRVPAWPIAFGDHQQAEKLLQTALTINPNGIDSNYFYAKFLLANDKIEAAKRYFAKALAAPIRPEQPYADQQLKEEAKHVLQKLAEQKISEVKS